MINAEILRRELTRALNRFAHESLQLWMRAQRQYFLDLRQDSCPWSSPLRPANTNGSVLLDCYVRLIDPKVVEEIGLEFAIAWMVMGVVTEKSGVFTQSNRARTL